MDEMPWEDLRMPKKKPAPPDEDQFKTLPEADP